MEAATCCRWGASRSRLEATCTQETADIEVPAQWASDGLGNSRSRDRAGTGFGLVRLRRRVATAVAGQCGGDVAGMRLEVQPAQALFWGPSLPQGSGRKKGPELVPSTSPGRAQAEVGSLHQGTWAHWGQLAATPGPEKSEH